MKGGQREPRSSLFVEYRSCVCSVLCRFSMGRQGSKIVRGNRFPVGSCDSKTNKAGDLGCMVSEPGVRGARVPEGVSP